MNFHMAMIGHRFEQPQHMLAGRRVETINQYSVRSAIVGSKLKLGIADHDVPLFLIRSSDPTCSEILVSFELEAMRISLLFWGRCGEFGRSYSM